MFVTQRFARQKNEDGPDPSAKWGKDLLIADTKDPDDEDYMSIPDIVSIPTSGKTRSSIQDWSEDDDDCQILEVYDPCPITFSYPLPSTSADSGGQVLDVPPLAVGLKDRSGSAQRPGPPVPGLPEPPALRRRSRRRRW